MRPSNPVLVCGLAGLLFSGQLIADHDTTEALEARLAPEGKLNIVEPGSEPVVAESAAAAPATAQDGASVYNSACVACHGSGVAGAPKIGDIAAWESRIGQGMAILVEHAIAGFQGDTGVMPAKGGNAALSDTAVSMAVEHMVAESGGEAATETETATETAPQTDSGETASSNESTAMAAGVDGTAIYNQSCVACHSTGVAGAPKVGDAGAWADRIAQGPDVLYDHAITGFQGNTGVMIARGGNAALSDEEVKAAVDHMVGQSQ